MFCFRKKEANEEGRWIVFNPGTDLQFAECSVCGYEDNDNLFINLMISQEPGEYIVTRCPKCGARMTGWMMAETENVDECK